MAIGDVIEEEGMITARWHCWQSRALTKRRKEFSVRATRQEWSILNEFIREKVAGWLN